MPTLKLALSLGIGGLLPGLAGSFVIAPIYKSSATLQITSIAADGESAEAENQQFDEMIRMAGVTYSAGVPSPG